MSESLLRMPRLGETMEEGEIADWLVEVGQPFARGEALIEIETDKTVVEYPALGAGTLLERLVEAGERVAVGAPIARVDVGDGVDWTGAGADGDGERGKAGAEDVRSAGAAGGAPDKLEAGAEVETADAGAGTEAHAAADDREVAPPRTPLPAGLAGPARSGGPLRATPAARRVARAHDIDIGRVPGSGRLGRVERVDVERAVASAAGGEGAPVRSGGNVAGDPRAHAPGGGVRWSGGVAFGDTGSSDGTGDGATFLLLHGFAADRTAFAATANALAKAGCRVIAPDLPGHGATRHEAERVEDLVTGLAELCRETIGAAAVHIVAHSLGAAPALALARERSLTAASLTLIAPAGIGSAIDAAFVRGMAAPASIGELSHLLRRASTRAAPLSADALQALYRTLSAGRLRLLGEALLGTSGQAIDLLPAIGQLAERLPVRVLVGQRDRIVDPRDALALPSSVAVHHFAEAGHLPHWDAPREVLALLLRRSVAVAGRSSPAMPG